MKDRRWFRRLCCFYKILNNQTPGYLYSLLVPPNRDYNTRRYTKFRQIFCRTETFSNSFLPQTIREWNKLDTSICQAPSYSVFRKALLDFIWHLFVLVSAISENINLNIIFKIHWTHCALVPLKQKTPITFLCAAKIFLINEMFFLMTLIQLTRIFWKWMSMWLQVLLSGNKSFSKDMNYRIMTSSIRFIRDRKKLDESLFSWEKSFLYIFTTEIKIKKYLLWRAVKFSFWVCIVLYIYLYFFNFSIVCRCVCYDE